MTELKKEDVPEIIYKYYALSGDSRKYTLRVIEQSKIFFANPIEHFNDPFDCRLEIEFGESLEKWKKAAERFLGGKEKNPTTKQIYDVAIDGRKKSKNPEWRERFHTDIVKRYCVFCLSDTNSNILMYSHYADKHRGICIGLNMKNLVLHFDDLDDDTFWPVKYIDEYDPPDFLDDDERKVADWLLCTKLIDWSYEREWRITSRGKKGECDFPEQILVEIILGCQISSEDETTVRKINAQRKYPAKLFKAKKKRREIGLDIVPID